MRRGKRWMIVPTGNRYMSFRLRKFHATAVLIAIAFLALPGWAKKRWVPNDTLTDYNVAPTDGPGDVAILRAVQKTHDPQGQPIPRVPGIRIFSLRHEQDKGKPRPLPSQHLRLKPGNYVLYYACALGTSQLESAYTITLSAGRRYYIYCESRNINHYELKVTEVP